MRIGILGGSFDPPHLAHRALAECAISELKLDLLYIAVAYRQWQKQHDADADSRLAMCQLNFDIPQCEVTDVDLQRATPTFTIDTLDDLKRAHPGAEFVFITGADAVAGLGSWQQSQTLAKSLKFAAAARNGEKTTIPEGFDVSWLECLLPEISSSEIREILESENRNRSDLEAKLSPAVISYIFEHDLYS